MNTLDKWLNINNQIPTFFYFKEKKRAIWSNEEPEQINFKKVLHWKKYHTNIIICGYFITPEYKIPNPDYVHVPILKSALQKSIRLKNTNSVNIGYELIKNNLFEFLRRLPIILLEDTKLHFQVINIIWMLCALPKWKITTWCLEWCLGFIYTITQIHTKDNMDKTDINLLYDLLKNKIILKQKYIETLLSIELRKSYGGLKGDILLLNSITNIWLERFNRKIEPINSKIKRIKIESVYFNKKMIPLSAIDFHVYPNIINKISLNFEYDIEQIKYAIWHNSSNINNRTEHNYNEYIEIWNDIKNDFYKLAKSLFSR